MSTAAWIRLAALAAIAAALLTSGPPSSEPPTPPSLDLAHTRHRNPDGSPRYTNRLAREASPYLRQHAHNPVDWYPWGEEAFAKARAERKPIFLSIGYATCHWCHVMADESFEDDEIAAELNDRYVAIKVDREQRPDVDAIYMGAVQAMGHGGGWPLNVWLTPDLRPFWGGTYFPPRAGDRGQKAGLLDFLRQLDAAWREKPDRVTEAAADLAQRLEEAFVVTPGTALPTALVLKHAEAQLAAQFDREHGGFGRTPKFPRPVALDLLLRWHRRTGDADALGMVVQTLDAMAAGGVHDHVGGGFHRYAVDRLWQIPHFEKMLYDNALLASLYLAAARAGSRPDYAAVATLTLDWLLRDMQTPDGGFYAAVDADSGGEEGRFYTWTPEEVAAVLDPETTKLVLAYYGITPGGNFESRSVLHVGYPLADLAERLRITPDEAARRLADARERLRSAREGREHPAVDRKVIAAWNGLAISALAQGAQTLGDPRYAEAAARTADLVTTRMRDGSGRLARSMVDGVPSGRGVLEDYAFVVAGLLDLYEATGTPRWLVAAIDLQNTQDRHFGDDAGGWFRTAHDAETLLAREKPDYDGAEPSGSSVAVLNVLRLYALTGDDRWRAVAENALRAFEPSLAANPERLALMAGAVEFWLDRPKEIVIVTPPGSDAAPLLAEVRERYLPNRALSVVEAGDAQRALAPLVPLVADKTARDGKPTAYVCERQVCRLPTTDPAALGAELDRVAPLS